MARTLGGPSGFSFGTVNQSLKTQTITFNFYVSSNGQPADFRIRSWWQWGYSASPTPANHFDYEAGPPVNYTLHRNGRTFSADCDDQIYTAIKGSTENVLYIQQWTQTKNTSHGKTHAADPTLGDAPTLDNEGKTSVRINNANVDDFIPATKDTGVTLSIQYKKTSDGGWTTGATLKSSQTGYTSRDCGTTTVTGLDPDTSYDFRYYLNRAGTSNPVTTDYYSAKSTTSTLPNDPVITTLDPNQIGISEASFRVNIVSNGNDGTISCRWSATNPGTPDDTSGTAVLYSDTIPNWTGDGIAAGFGGPEGGGPVTGLIDVDETQAETFYVWSIYKYGGVAYDGETVFGDIVEFQTLADPAAGGDEADFMIPLQFDGQYATARTVYFTLRAPAGSNNDTFYASTAPAAGDVDIFRDGVEWQAGSGSDNAPQRVGSTKLYSLQLSATEMTGTIIDVIISDVSGAAFRDLHIQIRTKQVMSQVDLDTSNMSGAQSAFKATGVGAGHGIEAIGGATGHDISGILGKHVLAFGNVTSDASTTVTLANGFDATDDIYNGDVIFFYAGTGSGQSRAITDFTLGGVATLSSALISSLDGTTKYIIIPGARALEVVAAPLTTVPTANSTVLEKIQFIYQRFAYRIKQTATAQTWYESDGSTEFATRAVSDTGSVQDLAALQNP
jgi:hypothetical protein